jgi:hypothetical protein
VEFNLNGLPDNAVHISGFRGEDRSEPHGVTTQKTPFYIVTAVKTSNLI